MYLKYPKYPRTIIVTIAIEPKIYFWLLATHFSDLEAPSSNESNTFAVVDLCAELSFLLEKPVLLDPSFFISCHKF